VVFWNDDDDDDDDDDYYYYYKLYTEKVTEHIDLGTPSKLKA
jgi:hypothetical protein